MKAVLIAIRPKWCEKIFHEIGTDKNGKPIYEKKIEVRKTKPSIPTPFKAYVCCTQERVLGEILLTYDKKVEGRNRGFRDVGDIPLAGKVIGEFICDKVERLEYQEKYLRGITSQTAIKYFRTKIKSTALSIDEIMNYGKGKTLYGWHITDLKIYDKPKELNEFNAVCRYINADKSCHFQKVMCPYQEFDFNKNGSINIVECSRVITRPPQSWRYVEDLGEVK